MDPLILRTIGGKELRAGLRNRWFLLYTLLFLVLSVAFATVAIAGSTLTGQPGCGRSAAGLMNLMLLIVPLIGLTVGAQAIVAEREDRFLDFQLAQPVAPAEVYIGKYLGAAVSLILMLAFGLGAAGVILAVRGGAADASVSEEAAEVGPPGPDGTVLRQRERDLQDRITESQRIFRERSRAIEQAAQGALMEIEQALGGVIRQVAASRSVNLVLPRPLVIFNEPPFDLTNEVSQQFNRALRSVTIPPESAGEQPAAGSAPRAGGGGTAPAAAQGGQQPPAQQRR